ncbi:hypothetical protein TOPH_06902 [Tolypocladium ophioglossoides CBS 100239]|uniref:Uncharacterized protein n=1 Tax=Tolypocladium ophioglossoides (strain CBS 100239) TaxID=1163406 RepID=A0A0L0N417_TOLOC|nr:hypothetical protein TOPH_06902 [Tolypocladium ophioglossoides CBS 100239]
MIHFSGKEPVGRIRDATLPPAQYSVTIHTDWPTREVSMTALIFLAPLSLRSVNVLTSLRISLTVSTAPGSRVSPSSMLMILTATSCPELVPVALYTRPKLPLPISSRSSYGGGALPASVHSLETEACVFLASSMAFDLVEE